MGTPKADIAIDINLVQELLEAQHPDFAKLSLKHLDTGWDNVMFQLGDTYLVRLPRRQVAAQLLRNEQIWLPQLASLKLIVALGDFSVASLFPILSPF